MILNIETSSKICSVSLTEEGTVWFSLESDKEMDHSTQLAPFMDRCITEMRHRDKELAAVAVSLGPGSYTGLRIGLSLAKGLCFGLNVPLIGINTLKLLSVKALFSCMDCDDTTVLIPMIDARRDEVYTAAFDIALNELMPPTPLILESDSYREFDGRSIIMIGDGVKKAKKIIQLPVKKWIDAMPHASDMTALSEKALREGDFLDIAYSTPFYLKNFQATTPKPLLTKIY